MTQGNKIRPKWVPILLAAAAIYAGPAISQTQEDIRTEIQQIKQQLAQMEELKARLAALEEKLDESEEAGAPATVGSPDERVKIDGRLFLGVFDTGDEGAYPNWSTDASDAKLKLTFRASENMTFVSRLSVSSARTTEFDYLYLDYAGVLGPASTIRIGQRKIGVGQETLTDNPVENMLITNSASHISGSGIGAALLGRFRSTDSSPLYELGFANGSRGVTARPTNSLPFSIKLGAPLPNNMFASASYFDSGDMGADGTSPISVAEISSAPASATEWRRRLWELDLRYNYGTSGSRPLIPTGDLPRLMLGATYGAFSDDVIGAADRDGKFWFIEGLYRMTDRLYGAARHSAVELDDGVLAALARSPVAVNSYRRTSLGLGYRLTDLTHLKTEYTFNDTSGGSSAPSLNQWAIGMAAKF